MTKLKEDEKFSREYIKAHASFESLKAYFDDPNGTKHGMSRRKWAETHLNININDESIRKMLSDFKFAAKYAKIS